MRILFLSNFYPPADRGGYEQWCQEIADALRSRGHRVVVATSRYGIDHVHDHETDVHRVLYLESDINHYRPLDFFLRLPQRDRYNLSYMENLIREYQPEALLIWGMWQLNPQLAVLAEQLCPNRVGYYFCGFWPITAEELDPHVAFWQRPENSRWKNALKQPVTNLVLARLQEQRRRQPQLRHVACVSRFVLNTYQRYGLAPDGCVIYGGIQLDRFYRRMDEPQQIAKQLAPLRLLYAGNVAPQKGVDTIVKAVAELAPKFSPQALQVTIVGSGHPDFGRYLRNFVQEHQLEPYISFQDWIDKDSMPQLMHEFDVLLFSSIWGEPLARTMLQGMAGGLTLITTTTGGSGEAIEHERNGLTFEAGNAADLARQIERLLCEPGLVCDLGRAGQQTALAKFDFNRMVSELESFVSEIVR